jgi:hypothetical protein
VKAGDHEGGESTQRFETREKAGTAINFVFRQAPLPRSADQYGAIFAAGAMICSGETTPGTVDRGSIIDVRCRPMALATDTRHGGRFPGGCGLSPVLGGICTGCCVLAIFA